jgi:hypothetical protein
MQAAEADGASGDRPCFYRPGSNRASGEAGSLASLAAKSAIWRILPVTKSIKSSPAALSKAGGHWYIPPATSRPLRPRVAFSGSLWTEAAPSGVDPAVSAFSKGQAKVYRGVEQPGSSSGS